MLVVLELDPELITARGLGGGTPITASLDLRPSAAATPVRAALTEPAARPAAIPAPERSPRPRTHRKGRRRVLKLAPLTAAAALVGTAIVAGSHDNPATQPAVADEAVPTTPAHPLQTVKVDTPRFIPIDRPISPDPAARRRHLTPTRPTPTRPPTDAPLASGPAALGLDLTRMPLTTAGDIPAIAHTAYATAASRADADHPACSLTWQQLAAVGYLASDHGRASGRHISAGGVVEPPLFGTPLDGRVGYEYADSDHGTLDHSTIYDRGVGPLQVLPYVWRAWAADGDEDGVKDPQQLDDAALTAADFLCAAAPTLRTDAGFRQALRTYDPQYDFAKAAMAVARTYAGLPAAGTAGAAKGKHRKPATNHRAARTSGSPGTTK